MFRRLGTILVAICVFAQVDQLLYDGRHTGVIVGAIKGIAS